MLAFFFFSFYLGHFPGKVFVVGLEEREVLPEFGPRGGGVSVVGGGHAAPGREVVRTG